MSPLTALNTGANNGAILKRQVLRDSTVSIEGIRYTHPHWVPGQLVWIYQLADGSLLDPKISRLTSPTLKPQVKSRLERAERHRVLQMAHAAFNDGLSGSVYPASFSEDTGIRLDRPFYPQDTDHDHEYLFGNPAPEHITPDPCDRSVNTPKDLDEQTAKIIQALVFVLETQHTNQLALTDALQNLDQRITQDQKKRDLAHDNVVDALLGHRSPPQCACDAIDWLDSFDLPDYRADTGQSQADALHTEPATAQASSLSESGTTARHQPASTAPEPPVHKDQSQHFLKSWVLSVFDLGVNSLAKLRGHVSG